jgi:hypothetical protein
MGQNRVLRKESLELLESLGLLETFGTSVRGGRPFIKTRVHGMIIKAAASDWLSTRQLMGGAKSDA